jgi:ubiquinone/menaquinone biosynthesis C-methylase UbiE
MTATTVRHPLFARMYTRMAPAFEAKGAAEHRDEMLAGVTGRVIEVGAGTGLNFRHYPDAVAEVVAVEPEPYLRERAAQAASEATVPVKVIDGVAGALPVDSASFDVAVASLVLCSVDDQAKALNEIRRVLRPGGELRFLEHVRASKPRKARVQRALDHVWPRLGGGCHTARNTRAAIEAAGFAVDRARSFEFLPSVAAWPVSPHIVGVAHRPG